MCRSQRPRSSDADTRTCHDPTRWLSVLCTACRTTTVFAGSRTPRTSTAIVFTTSIGPQTMQAWHRSKGQCRLEKVRIPATKVLSMNSVDAPDALCDFDRTFDRSPALLREGRFGRALASSGNNRADDDRVRRAGSAGERKCSCRAGSSGMNGLIGRPRHAPSSATARPEPCSTWHRSATGSEVDYGKPITPVHSRRRGVWSGRGISTRRTTAVGPERARRVVQRPGPCFDVAGRSSSRWTRALNDIVADHVTSPQARGNAAALPGRPVQQTNRVALRTTDDAPPQVMDTARRGDRV